MAEDSSKLQLIWGIALVAAGVGVFFRIPQVIPRLKQIDYFAGIIYFVYFCFYLIAILLIGGGSKKIVAYFRAARASEKKPPSG
jgi:hypothetical protein